MNDNDEAWNAVDINPTSLFVGNTESGFMGLEARRDWRPVCQCQSGISSDGGNARNATGHATTL